MSDRIDPGLDLDRVVVEERPIPAAVDAPGWTDFAAAIAIESAKEVANYGSAEFAIKADEQLAFSQRPAEPHRWVVARVGDRILAHGVHETRLEDGADTAWLGLSVVPELRGRLEPLVWDHLEAMARDGGAQKAIVYVSTPPTSGPTLSPPTGAGSVPADAIETRTMLARGYRLEQVERASRFPLPGDAAALAAIRADAERAAHGYDVVTWMGATPVEFREDMALLATRMSTDAPSAGLEEPEDVWTVDRLVEAEASHPAGVEFLTASARELATGRLVAYTKLKVAELSAPADQWATLVLREHRGHRLGMLIKAANLQFLQSERPGHPSVLTWNAEENRPMLDVNEALGFVPVGYEGAWRLDL